MKTNSFFRLKLSSVFVLIMMTFLISEGPGRIPSHINKLSLKPLNLSTAEIPIERDKFISYEIPPSINEHSFPLYPSEAKNKGIEGTVILILTIDKTGEVVRAEIEEEVHPLLDNAALESAYQLKFSPARMSGEPVKSYIQYPVTFLLE